MRQCKKCHHENDDAREYCENCGDILSVEKKSLKKSISFLLSRRSWMNILLKALIVIEILFAISIIVDLFQGDWERFLIGLIGLGIFHLLAWLLRTKILRKKY